MSTRLAVIESLIEPADIIADVGCDHGRIAMYCVKNRLANKVIASDISEKCLQKAKQLLSGETGTSFICCDGICYDCDQAIIAGMGGRTIIDILSTAKSLPSTVILSPHRDTDMVRRTIIGLGYGIDRDVPLVDRNKFYSVIRGKLGYETKELSELQIAFGLECDKQNVELRDWLLSQYTVCLRAPHRNKEKIEKLISALLLQGVNLAHNQS